MALLFALWFGVWFYLADVADKRVTAQISQSAENGIELNCANQEIRGFPFRIGLFCDTVAIDNNKTGFTLNAGALRTVSQMYQPNHMIVELDAPLSVQRQDKPDYQVLWSLARSSVKFGMSGLQNLSLEAENISAALPDVSKTILTAKSGEFHARPSPKAPADDIDLALKYSQLKLVGDGYPKDLWVDVNIDLLHVDGQIDWARAQQSGRSVFADGGEFLLRQFLVSLPEGIASGAIQLSGPLRFDEAGYLYGELTIAITGIDAIVDQIEPLIPEQSRQTIKQILSMVEGFGQRSEINQHPARAIKINIDRGAMRAGFFPLGFIPPLELGQ